MFKARTQYRVLKFFQTPTASFLEGEVLIFKEATYSRYDSSSGFVFETQGGELKAWFLHDDDPDDSKERFASVI